MRETSFYPASSEVEGAQPFSEHAREREIRGPHAHDRGSRDLLSARGHERSPFPRARAGDRARENVRAHACGNAHGCAYRFRGHARGRACEYARECADVRAHGRQA